MRIWPRRAMEWMLSPAGTLARSRAINVGTAAYGVGCTSVTANSMALMPAPVRPCRMPPCARRLGSRLRRGAPMGVGRSRGLLAATCAQVGEEGVDVAPGVLAAGEAARAAAGHAAEGDAGDDRDRRAFEPVARIARPADEQGLDVVLQRR